MVVIWIARLFKTAIFLTALLLLLILCARIVNEIERDDEKPQMVKRMEITMTRCIIIAATITLIAIFVVTI